MSLIAGILWVSLTLKNQCVMSDIEWRVIPMTNDIYEVSSTGKIRRVVGLVNNQSSGKSKRKVGGKVLSQKTKSNGYKEVNLYIAPQVSKMMYVHRAVAMAFYGVINSGLAVNHKNGKKSDNRVDNLEIVTYSKNSKHAVDLNLFHPPVFRGEQHSRAKLSEKQVLEIRAMYKDGVMLKALSEQFKTPKGTIAKICYRQTWKHL